MRRTSRRNRGFTLTEIAIVLGIIGAVTAGIWVAANSAHEAQKESDAVGELTAVVQNLSSLMAGQNFTGPFPNNITANMITGQVIPQNYINPANTSTADNPWSPQDFIVKATSATSYAVIFNNVPSQGCVALLTRATACQTGQAACPTKISGNAGGSYLPNPGPLPVTGWVTIATPVKVLPVCQANSAGTNTIELDYSL